MFKHILLATDGSAASEHATAIAVDLARTHAVPLTVLYVVDPYPYLGVGEANPAGFQAYMAAALQHAGAAHAHAAELCERAGIGMNALVEQDVGAVAGIVQAARATGAGLVVVGSHGRTGISRLMLGSVAARVVAESPVPVLVAR